MKIVARLLGLSSLVVLLGASALQAQEPVVIHLGHPNGLQHPMGRTLTAMGQDVSRATEGRIAIEQQYAGPSTAFSDVKSGKLDAAGIATFYWTTQGAVGGLDHAIPSMDLMMIPYALTDIARLKRFPTSSLARKFEARVAATGVHPLMWLFITNTAIITSVGKPVIEPEDLKGLHMRSLRGLNETMFRMEGATPTPMPPAQVSKWIADGKGDGGTTDVYAASVEQWARTQKYGTIAPLYSVFYLIFVNQTLWDKITPADRRLINAAARAAEQSQFDRAAEADRLAIADLRAAGMVLHMQTPRERKRWSAAVAAPLAKVYRKNVPDGGQLLELAARL